MKTDGRALNHSTLTELRERGVAEVQSGAAMVQTQIAERYKVKLSHSSVCRLLHQLGLSAQRPLWRAYQQNPEAVKHWLATEYPTIQRRARREGATIFFSDEAGVRSDFHSGTTWGLRGRTPVVSSTDARFGVNLISAVSAQGQLRFMLTKGRVTAAVPLARLFLADGASRVRDLATDPLISTKAREKQDRVTELFDKYNLLALPVL